MSQTTQCPACQTRFKVSDAHLALASGMVRCGRCSHVFHAPSHFDDVAAAPAPQHAQQAAPVAPPAQNASQFEADDDFELELPDFQPEPQPAVSPPAAKAPIDNDLARDSRVDLDLPDYELMQPPPETPIDWDDFDEQDDVRYTPSRAAPAMPPERYPEPEPASADDDSSAQNEQQDLAAFQRALAEALTSDNRPARRIALFDEAPAAAAAVAPAQTPAIDEYELPGRQSPQASWQTPEPATDAAPSGSHDDDEQQERPDRQAWLKNVLLAGASTIGIVLLAAQLIFINRTAVSAQLPELRPAFESLCQQFGCEVPLPTQRQLIRTEWSELSFVPQHEHLIQLNATLRNLAPYPQALPLLELSLKDGDDKLIIRKTLKPEEYLAKDDLALGRFNANSEIKIVTRMEVSQVKALGYSLHFYYP